MIHKTITIVCPVYNEEQVVRRFYEELRTTLLRVEHSYNWRVLFVVDRSSDQTLPILRALAAEDERVQVLGLSARFGHQMSLVAGIDHAHSDAVIMMDSDLQHPPELIPELIDSFERGYDVVYTVRREPADCNMLKRIGSRGFYRVLNWLAEIKVESGAADYRLISRRVAEVFRTRIRERNQFLRGLFCWVGFRQIGVVYEPRLRTAGSSKYGWSRMLRFAVAGIISFSNRPLQFAITLGLFAASLGSIFALFAVGAYFIADRVPSGWTSLAILISFFCGVQLFFLGVLGEYVGAIFDEVKGRPLYIIDEAINLEQ